MVGDELPICACEWGGEMIWFGRGEDVSKRWEAVLIMAVSM